MKIDVEGYDENGYDEYGFDRNGLNAAGLTFEEEEERYFQKLQEEGKRERQAAEKQEEARKALLVTNWKPLKSGSGGFSAIANDGYIYIALPAPSLYTRLPGETSFSAHDQYYVFRDGAQLMEYPERPYPLLQIQLETVGLYHWTVQANEPYWDEGD